MIAPFVDAPPSHAGHRIIIRDYDTSIVGNRELFHFLSSRFRRSAGGRVARLENGHPLPSTKTLLSYAKATGSRFHVRLSAA
ncbi:MAG: hypothetical protein WBF73_35355 [Bradyrhizobium sp.]